MSLVRKLVDQDPKSLLRRRSRFESGQTPLHAAFAPPDVLGFLSGKPDDAMLELLIALGAELEATDDKGRTPLAVAMLRGDREAMRLLRAAGVAEPGNARRADLTKQIYGGRQFSIQDNNGLLRVRRPVLVQARFAGSKDVTKHEVVDEPEECELSCPVECRR